MKNACITIKNNITASKVRSSSVGKLISSVRSESIFTSVWINHEGTSYQFLNERPPIQIELSQLIMEKSLSNGDDCKLNVFQARMGEFNMVLKFREVNTELKNEKFSEKEGNKAMNTEYDENIRYLFPRLYCMVDFYVNSSPPSHWEAIGTEILSELTVDDRSQPLFYSHCYTVLRQLHRGGYAHRDPHGGNFMKNSRNHIKLIDQDEIIPLPTNRPTLAKFLQILDSIELLFWNNFYCEVFPNTDFNKKVALWHMAYTYSPTHTPHLVPYGYVYYKKLNNLDKMEDFLQNLVERKQGKTYWMYLESVTLEDIQTYFYRIFSTIKNMQEMQIQIENLTGTKTTKKTQAIQP